MKRVLLLTLLSLALPLNAAQRTFNKPFFCSLVTNELNVKVHMHENETCIVSIPETLERAVSVTEENGKITISQEHNNPPACDHPVEVTLHPLCALFCYLSGNADVTLSDGEFFLHAILHNGGKLTANNTFLSLANLTVLGSGTIELRRTEPDSGKLFACGAADIILADGTTKTPGSMRTSKGAQIAHEVISTRHQSDGTVITEKTLQPTISGGIRPETLPAALSLGELTEKAAIGMPDFGTIVGATAEQEQRPHNLGILRIYASALKEQKDPSAASYDEIPAQVRPLTVTRPTFEGIVARLQQEDVHQNRSTPLDIALREINDFSGPAAQKHTLWYMLALKSFSCPVTFGPGWDPNQKRTIYTIPMLVGTRRSAGTPALSGSDKEKVITQALTNLTNMGKAIGKDGPAELTSMIVKASEEFAATGNTQILLDCHNKLAQEAGEEVFAAQQPKHSNLPEVKKEASLFAQPKTLEKKQRSNKIASQPTQKENSPAFFRLRSTLLNDKLYSEVLTGPMVRKINSCKCSENERQKLWALYLYRMLNIRQWSFGGSDTVLSPEGIYKQNWKPFSKVAQEAALFSALLGLSAGLITTMHTATPQDKKYTLGAVAGIASAILGLILSFKHHSDKKIDSETFKLIAKNQRSILQHHQNDIPEEVRNKLEKFINRLNHRTEGSEEGAPEDAQKSYQKIFLDFRQELKPLFDELKN